MMVRPMLKTSFAIRATSAEKMSQAEIAEKLGVSQSPVHFQLNDPYKFKEGHVAERWRTLGEELGVAMAVVDADIADVDQRIAEKFGRLTMVWDWPKGRVLVGLESGALVTVPAFVKMHGRDAERWVELTPESRRNCPDVGTWLAKHPERGGK